jgi:anion-transporting  ArsA/GET3 family ATPase
MMLDTKSTFDALITRYATSDEQRTRILENSFYRNISGALSGTQEYMAMEKLHELDEEGGFDLIVVDTPPSRHALDFLDAPQRLLRLLDNRVFRLLMVPTRTYLKVAGAAVQAFIKTLSRVVGSEVVNDIVAFFRAFEGMEEGFRERAHKVVELLGESTTRFVLITSPRRDAVDEARFFAEKIGDHDLAVDALIVNRVHPRFGTEHASGLRARATSLRELRVGSKEAAAARTRLAARYQNLADFNEIAERERSHLEAVRVRVGSAAVAFVPYLAHDVYDFDALAAVGQLLFTVDGDAELEAFGPGGDG